MTADQAHEDVEVARGLSDGEMERKLALIKTRDSGKYMTNAEKQELEELLAIEKRENDRKALIHVMSSEADSYGRKLVSRIRREVTDRVKKHAALEKADLTMLNLRFAKERSELEQTLRKGMQKLQGRHNVALNDFQVAQMEAEGKIRAVYRIGYDDLNDELEREMNAVTVEVAEFIGSIQELDLEHLQTLQSAGTWQDESSENTDPIVVPGTQKDPA